MSRKQRFILLSLAAVTTSALALAAINQARRSHPSAANTQSASADKTTEATSVLKSGKLAARTLESARKQHFSVSPDHKLAIYHLPFDPYKIPPEPVVFIVADHSKGIEARTILVRWAARYIAAIDWIDDQFVTVRGEDGYLAILDAQAGRLTHNLRGSNFTLSPDGTQMVYNHDFNPRYGAIQPAFQSDYVLFSLIRSWPDFERTGRLNAQKDFRVIYPKPLSWGQTEQKAYDDLSERHQLKNSFAWSADSRYIAFLENYRMKLWLVVLQPTPNNETTVRTQKFELGDANQGVALIAWESDGNHIKVTSDKRSWLVELIARKVQATS